MTDLTQTQIETLTSNFDVTEDEIDSMDEDTLAVLASNLDQSGDGRDEITSSTATAIAMTRAWVEDATYDGGDVEIVVEYGPDAPDEDEVDGVLVVVDNETFGNHRAEWMNGIVDHVADAFSGGNGAQYRKFTRENLESYQDLARTATKDGIGATLSDAGHAVDDVKDEFEA